MSLPIELSLRVSLVFALAFAVTWILRRRMAALRHVIWTCAFGVAASAPVLLQFGPRIRIERPAAAIDAAPIPNTLAEAAPLASQQPKPPRNIPFFEIAWLAGVLACLARIWNASRKTRALLKNATLLKPGIAESDAVATAMTLGVFRPSILLPREHRLWEPELLQAVLLHELAHVRRRDCLVQWLPNLVCAAHWFNPLVWLARSEMLCEAERACDDAVIRSGISGSTFARDLVGVAQSLQLKGNSLMSTAVTTKLERRIARLIDPAADRRPLTIARAVVGAAAALLLLAPIAGVKAEQVVKAGQAIKAPKVAPVPARAAPAIAVKAAPRIVAQIAQTPPTGSLSGVVTDPTGAVISGATVRIVSAAAPNTGGAITGGRGSGVLVFLTTSSSIGKWNFLSIPTGMYDLEVVTPGFSTFKRTVTVSAGGSTQVNSPVAIGRISEAVTITAAKPAGMAASPQAAQAQTGPIRVGGNVQAAKLIRKVSPTFPASAQAQGVEGAVTIEAIVDKAGFISSARAIGGAQPDLAQAALDAVQQWQYTPTLLNGEPVEVMTEITVSFTLQ